MPYVKKTVKATTNNITTGIVNFLLEKGHSASRVNVTGIYDEVQGKFRTTGSRIGFYDICAVIKTRFGIGLAVMIDVKRGKDKLSKGQIEFREEVITAGGECFESKNYNDFVVWYYGYICPKYL